MAKQEEIVATIAEWRRSGMSKAAFARTSGIPVNTFHYWCKRHDSAKASSAPAFIELPEAAGDASHTERVRVQLALPDGLVITVY